MHKFWKHIDLILIGLSILFLIAYALPILYVRLDPKLVLLCSITVWITWVVFAIEYVLRFSFAPRKRVWFFQHLPDLVMLTVPTFRPLRLLRLITLVQVFERSAKNRIRGKVGVYASGISIVVIFSSALAVLDSERTSSNANITSFQDALWWSCETVSTVGYGDFYPVTSQGRIIGFILMVAGIALAGTVTGTFATWLIEKVEDVRYDNKSDSLVIEELRKENTLLKELLGKSNSE